MLWNNAPKCLANACPAIRSLQQLICSASSNPNWGTPFAQKGGNLRPLLDDDYLKIMMVLKNTGHVLKHCDKVGLFSTYLERVPPSPSAVAPGVFFIYVSNYLEKCPSIFL